MIYIVLSVSLNSKITIHCWWWMGVIGSTRLPRHAGC